MILPAIVLGGGYLAIANIKARPPKSRSFVPSRRGLLESHCRSIMVTQEIVLSRLFSTFEVGGNTHLFAMILRYFDQQRVGESTDLHAKRATKESKTARRIELVDLLNDGEAGSAPKHIPLHAELPLNVAVKFTLHSRALGGTCSAG